MAAGRWLLLSALLYWLPGILVGQQSADSTTVRRVHIDRADRVRGSSTDTADYMFLSGNVELSEDSLFMYCDSAVIVNKREVYAYGNVTIQKGDTLAIYSDTLEYLSDSMMAILSGEVVLDNKAYQLWTNYLQYDLELDLASYFSGAILIGDSLQIASRRGYYWTKSDMARFADSVVAISPGVQLLSDTLLYSTAIDRAFFSGPTAIIHENSRIYCEDGYYDVLAGNADFSKNAEYIEGTQTARADTIRYDDMREEVYLLGNAHFSDEYQSVDADSIYVFQKTGDTWIVGNASLVDSSRQVISDRIEYNRETGYLKTIGRSTLCEGEQEITADSIDFDRETGIGFARGDVLFWDYDANVAVESDFARYNKTDDYVMAYGDFRPMLKTVMDGDTMFLTADSLFIERHILPADSAVFTGLTGTDSAIAISAVPDSSLIALSPLSADTVHTADSISTPDTSIVAADTITTFLAFYDVRLFRGTLQGLCDSLSFTSTDSVFRMIGDPVLWSDTTQFTADTVDIALRNSAIDRVYLVQNGLIVNEVQGMFYNQIKGRHMVARFDSSEVRDLNVTGNAESIYYAREDDGSYVGVNRVLASRIFFTFDQKQLRGIRLYSRPDGEMTPMEDVDHGTMRLEGFVWRDEIRPKTLSDLFE